MYRCTTRKQSNGGPHRPGNSGGVARNLRPALYRFLCISGSCIAARSSSSTSTQGLTLVHFSAQRKHFLWGALGDFMTKAAQVELNMTKCV